MAPPLLDVSAMTSSRHWVSGLVALPIASLFLVGGCSNGDDCHHSCPISSFAVDVPADRVYDVASITPTGPCASQFVTGFAPGVYFSALPEMAYAKLQSRFGAARRTSSLP